MMTLESLQQQLETYPERLQHALSIETKANVAVERIRDEIKQAQASAMLSTEDTPGERDTTARDEYERTKFQHDRLTAQIALQVRRDPSAYGLAASKVTEGAIAQIVLSNDEAVALKERLIDLDIQRRQPGQGYEQRPYGDTRRQSEMPVDSKLQAKLWRAEEAASDASGEVEALRAALDTYRMLTVILTNRAASASLSLDQTYTY